MKRIILSCPLVAIIIFLLYTGCNTSIPPPATAANTVHNDDEVVMALLYQQKAAEYKALCLQSYNLARLRVEQTINNSKAYTRKPFAVVSDLDETALDNSGNEAWLYLHDSAFTPQQFEDWSTYGHAGAVPGSVQFFNYVDKIRDKKGRKLKIYYISNRTATVPVVDSTKSQMNNLHFPQLVDSQFLFKPKGTTNSKEPRRKQVSATDTIILLLGDNLTDLAAVFDSTAGNPGFRSNEVDSLAAAWGNKYIVLPNATYGDWESALYPNGKYTALPKERAYRRQDLDTIRNKAH